MEKIYDLFERYRDYILAFILFVILVFSEAFLYCYIRNDLTKIKDSLNEKKEVINSPVKKDDKKIIYVDVKGEVYTPGVYSFDDGKRVVDAIEKAGGVTAKADTSINNLGKKLSDEMVIIVYSKKQVKKLSTIVSQKAKVIENCNSNVGKDNGCLKESDITEKSTRAKSTGNKSLNSTNSKTNFSGKVSINNASKDELMTLTGIGESKANNIIEYRSKTKFKKIEDLKNVNGIGDTIFEKIKDSIEL